MVVRARRRGSRSASHRLGGTLLRALRGARTRVAAVTAVMACGGEGGGREGRTSDQSQVRLSTERAGQNLAAPILPHATDFLTAGCYTHLYAGLDTAARRRCRDLIKARGYTHFYLYPYNEGDYGGPGFDYYRSPRRFRQYLTELRDAGLEPVVWLVPDDAPVFAALPAAAVERLFEQLLPAVDDLVSSYVLGLELDEYWPAQTVNRLGSRLRQLTTKAIAVHQTPRRWDYCKFEWCDYMILQYGFDASLDEIDRQTRAAIAELNKPVVAGEYEAENEARARVRGDRGVAAGAAGFGNGATPASVSRPRPASAEVDRD